MAATGELRESSVPVAASKLSGTLNRESRIGGMAGMAPELLLVPLYVFGSVQMHRIPALPLERGKPMVIHGVERDSWLEILNSDITGTLGVQTLLCHRIWLTSEAVR